MTERQRALPEVVKELMKDLSKPVSVHKDPESASAKASRARPPMENANVRRKSGRLKNPK